MSSDQHCRERGTMENLSTRKGRSKGGNDDDGSGWRSSRMDEAMRLREAMTNSSTYMKRKLLISQLRSPRREAENQFDDTDSDCGDDDGFEVSSFKEDRKGSENMEPNQEHRRGLCQAGRVVKVDVRCATTPCSKASSASNSVSSRVFQDQLSARFKSTRSTAKKVLSRDSCEE